MKCKKSSSQITLYTSLCSTCYRLPGHIQTLRHVCAKPDFIYLFYHLLYYFAVLNKKSFFIHPFIIFPFIIWIGFLFIPWCRRAKVFLVLRIYSLKAPYKWWGLGQDTCVVKWPLSVFFFFLLAISLCEMGNVRTNGKSPDTLVLEISWQNKSNKVKCVWVCAYNAYFWWIKWAK